MGDNRSQSFKMEVQELLIKPIQDVEERRQSIVGSAKLTRQGSIVAANYDQVSKGDMTRRYREQSLNPRRDSTLPAVQTEIAKAEPARSENYQIEVPKSGVFNRGEYFTPLYLPTGCEEERRSRYYEGFEQATAEDEEEESNEPSRAATPKDTIRNMVYCSDEVIWAEYQEQQGISSGAKTHFGLRFDSNFECGNLLKAETVQQRGAPLDALEEYDLTIRPDPAQFNKLDAPSIKLGPTCAQWFFFRVSNNKRKTYRFNIGPFSHRVEALEKGMKPVMISESAYKIHGTGWQRVGEDISFHEIVSADSKRKGSNSDNSGSNSKHPTFTLSFELTLEVAKDVFYLAFAPPYTYTQLQNMLFALVKDPIATKDLLVRPLCRTLAGNRCDVVTISENINTQSKNTAEVLSPAMIKYRASRENELQENDEEIPDFLWKLQQKMDAQRRVEEEKQAEKHRKKAVFVTARVHGGETVSSWMCEGLIKFLLSLHPTAVALKKVFVFYILPMVNPDGVVNGYSKSDILGTDLNQHWAEPSSALHPTLFHLKALMRRAQQGNGEIHAFFDLHGQAAKEGIFFHSVLSPSMRMLSNIDKNQKSDQIRGAEGIKEYQQVDPSSLEKGDPRNFTIAAARRCPLLNLKQCSLQLSSRKNTSARAVAATEFQVSLSVAVEASFHRSPAHKSKHAKQLMSADYARFGCVLALALADINHIGPPPSSRLLPSEKPTRACRASLKAAGLAQSMVQSAAAAAEAAVSAVNASLSTAPFASAVREESVVSTDSVNTKRSVIYTASQVVGSKRDSFVIGASVPLPHAEMLLSRSRAATATDADLDDTNTAESGILNTAEEHTHIFVSENIDPAEFDDTDLQLHYDEDKWDNVSDSSDADVLLPLEPGPPPVNDEGVINLTDDMLFNLRRYDELDLGIARVNPIALHAKMKLQAKPKVKVEAPVQNAEAGTDKTDQLPQIPGAAANADGADLSEGSNVVITNADPVPGSPFSPRRPSIQSPGRSSTAHSLRKSLKSGNSERAASRGDSQHARLHSATSAAADGSNGLELTMKAATERGQSRGGEVPVRMDRLAPDVEVVRISTAEPGTKPLTPHTNKKGVVKLNFTRDMAQGGLPGKQLGEPKGTVSFSVPANAAAESRFHELDLNEGSLTSDFDFSPTGAPESARTNSKVSPRKTSFSERTGSGKANYPVVMVPTAPLPSDSPDPDCTPKPVGNGRGASFFADSTEAVLLHSAKDAAHENFGQADGLHLKTNLEESEVVDTDAALSPFSIQLNVPVQGIDPLNNSMSPLFALYAGGAALYSERVAEMIEEQQRAKTAERLGTAAGSRPVTTHGSRLTTPALNTHTRATERGRPQTPPQVGESRLEGSALTENSRSKKMASMTLPFVRLAPTEQTRTYSHTSSSIMFDDSLADESVNAHFSGMSLLKLAPQRSDPSQGGAGHSHLSPSSHARAADASIPDTRTPLEKQQAQFLHEMGLEYKQLFGEQGVLSPQKKRQLSKQSPRSALEGKNAATYNTGFPLRRAMYERDAVQLRGNADETVPVLVHEKHKGVGRIRPVEKERVFLRHQLDQYYQHIEASLREQQLVEEAQTEITARRIFDLVHQVSLLDAEEQSRLLLQETIQRRWLARGGNWKGKHKFRDNHSHTSAQTESSVPQETPESRQLAYRKLRMKLKSHGSAEGSILQGYNDLIMGSEEDPGNGWQWLTGQEGSRDVLDNKDADNNVIIPTASISEHDVDRLGSAETGCGSEKSREVTPSSEVPARLAFNPLLPSDTTTIEQDSAVAAPVTRKVNKKQVVGGKKKDSRDVSASGKPFQRNGSPVLSAGSNSEPKNAQAHVHFPSQDHSQPQPLVQYAMDPNTLDGQVNRKPPRHLSLNPHSPARTLVSPPQVRISLFPNRADENKRSTSPTARVANQQMVFAPAQDPRTGTTNNSGRKDRNVKSTKRQLAVTLRSAPVDHRLHSAAPASAPALTDFPAQSLRSSPHMVPNEEHFPEAQPHTDELQPLPGIQSSTSTSSQQAAELMRMDSEYANYLRYGDIYTQSILAGVDTEQLSLHGSGLVLPSANTLRDNDNTANTVKFNPLLSKRLYAVASTQPSRSHQGDNYVNITSDTIESFTSSTELHGGAHLEEPTVEILARDLKQAIHTRQVELETTAPRVFVHPDKVLSPRRPVTERPSPMAKAKVTFVPPPVQDEGYPVSPRLAITASRPEGTVLKVTSPSHLKGQGGPLTKSPRC